MYVVELLQQPLLLNVLERKFVDLKHHRVSGLYI